MNLGVYVSTLNEEFLIEDTLKHVVDVFPQVEVIDLGSKDMTIERVNRFGIPINIHQMPVKQNKHDHSPGQEWTLLKNQYASQHDWVFFIDGDEIYSKDNLLKLKEKAGNEEYTGYRIGWRIVREADKQIQQSNIIINGPKLYKTSDYVFHRGWPNEVLRPINEEHKEPKETCDVWCWHGVLLLRTHSIKEDRPRVKKRMARARQYDKELKWENIKQWPWT